MNLSNTFEQHDSDPEGSRRIIRILAWSPRLVATLALSAILTAHQVQALQADAPIIEDVGKSKETTILRKAQTSLRLRTPIPVNTAPRRVELQQPETLQKRSGQSPEPPAAKRAVFGDLQGKNPVFLQLPKQDSDTVKSLDDDIKQINKGLSSVNTNLRKLGAREFYFERAKFYEDKKNQKGPVDKFKLTHWSDKDRKDMYRKITGRTNVKIDDDKVNKEVREFINKIKLDIASLLINAGSIAALVGNEATQLAAGKILESYLDIKITKPMKPADKQFRGKIEKALKGLNREERKKMLTELKEELEKQKKNLENKKIAKLKANNPS